MRHIYSFILACYISLLLAVYGLYIDANKTVLWLYHSCTCWKNHTSTIIVVLYYCRTQPQPQIQAVGCWLALTPHGCHGCTIWTTIQNLTPSPGSTSSSTLAKSQLSCAPMNLHVSKSKKDLNSDMSLCQTFRNREWIKTIITWDQMMGEEFISINLLSTIYCICPFQKYIKIHSKY